MAQNRGKVLVIDDDQAVCGFVEKMLLPRGISVACHADPFDGIERAREMCPDLIFINLLMGESNGLKVSKAIRSIDSLASVPVVIFVSYEGELDPKYTSTIGVVDVMVKPLKEKEFVSKTVAILQRYAGIEVQSPSSAQAAERPAAAATVAQVEEEEEDLLAGGKGDDAFAAFLAEEKDTAEAPAREARASVRHDFELPEEKQPNAGAAASAENDSNADQSFGQEEFVPDFDEIEQPLEKRKGKKVMLAVIGVLGLAGILLGAYFAKKIFVDGQEMALEKGMAGGDRKVITDNMPAAVPSLPKPGEVPVAQVPAVEQQPAAAATEKKDSPQAAVGPQQKLAEPAAASKPGAAPKQAAKAAEAPKAVETPKPVPAASQDKPKDAAPKKEAAAKPATARKSGKKWVVQVGLFSSEQNANSITEKLKQRGYSASSRQEKLADGQTRYRVTAGSYDSKQKAVDAQQALQQKEGIASVVHAF